jgi:hypothetical protein
MDRDENAARNILKERIRYDRAYRNFALDASNALGESISTLALRNPTSANWLVD